MALRGTLEHLGLASVVQLIGQNARHGVLTIEHDAEHLNLCFNAGQLVRADGTNDNKEDRIGERLVAADLISAQDLHQAAEQGGRLQQALLRMGKVDAAVLGRCAALHSTEAVHRAFTWTTGSYAFSPSPQAPIGGHPGLRAEHLLMEALRALDTWPALRARVPNDYGVYKVTRSLEDYLATQAMGRDTSAKNDFDDSFGFEELAAQGSSSGSAEPLTRADRLVYGLIDGKKDLHAVIGQSGLTAFDATAALVALLDAQLVTLAERVTSQPLPRDTLVLAAAPRRLSWRLTHVGPWALKAAYVAAALALWMFVRQGDLAQGTHAGQRFSWANEAPHIMQQLELTRAQVGAYPEALPADITHSGTAPLYAREGAGYRLRRL